MALLMVIHALVTFHLVHCSVFYMELPMKISQAAIGPKCDNAISCVFMSMPHHYNDWLPVSFWVQFTVTPKAFCGYFFDCICPSYTIQQGWYASVPNDQSHFMGLRFCDSSVGSTCPMEDLALPPEVWLTSILPGGLIFPPIARSEFRLVCCKYKLSIQSLA